MDQSMVEDAVDAQGRRADVTAQLQTLFSELSGMAQSDLHATVPFLELGLDSLFLTQASTAIHKTFGVKVAFRDLLEDASTLEAVAARIESELPPEAGATGTAPLLRRLPGHRSRRSGRCAGRGELRRTCSERESARARRRAADGVDVAATRDAPRWWLDAGDSRPLRPRRRDRRAAAGSDSRRAKPERSADRGTIAFGPYRPPAKGPTRRTDARAAGGAHVVRGALREKDREVEAVHGREPRSARRSEVGGGLPAALEGDGLSHRHHAVCRIEALGPRRERVHRPHQRLRDDPLRPQSAVHPRGDRGPAATGLSRSVPRRPLRPTCRAWCRS